MADGRTYRLYGIIGYLIECYVLNKDPDTFNDAGLEQRAGKTLHEFI
jgi:hypothetical protein